MAVVSPIPAIEERVGSMRSHAIDSPRSRSSRRELMEEPVARLIEEQIYVAVGQDVAKSKSTLIWALQNTGGKKICVIHVHQPAQMIPCMGTKFRASTVEEQEVRIYRESEREKAHTILDEYLRICLQRGVRAEKLYIEMDCIEKGIVELISQHGIRKLVMGAAADRHYSKRMTDLRSRKAIFVRREAPSTCHVWFTCKGYLIYTREAGMDETYTEYASPRYSISGSDEHQILSTPESDYQGSFSRVQSATSVQDLWCSRSLSGQSGRVSDGSLDTDEGEKASKTSPSQVSGILSRSGRSDVHSNQFEITEGPESAPGLSVVEENSDYSSPPSFPDGTIDDTFYGQIQQALADAHNSKREALAETFRRKKAEKDAIDAIKRAKQTESAYSEELKRRKEAEIALAKERDELEKMKNQREEVVEGLQFALDQRALLENQIAESDRRVKELEQKIISAVELLQSFKKERDELQMERDRVLIEAEELRRSRAEGSAPQLPQFFTDFSFSEIEEATNYFDATLKIGEGGYGSIYIGILRHTQVAIKLLNPNSSQGPVEYQQEVDVLSKMRHPNLITLIGACPEAWSLVYEYLPNGSLEDRLCCKDNSPPLSWQTRVRIATEICAALIFLHSNRPQSIVHGDLKPANILLDANFVSKLSDFGTCSLLCCNGSTNTSTDVKGTFAYMDPETWDTGELTPMSDVYAFGIILLRLLTGRPALRITNEVKYALDTGTLTKLLDPLAGDWPFVQAEQLARLALRCCENTSENRAELATEVWRVLEPMRASCGGSSSFRLGPKERCQAPSYFICPIFQEVMQDPHVAADGFTYEAEAVRAWLESGHDTSPMTNLKLAHTSLVPNHALRSAIQEWLQQHW